MFPFSSDVINSIPSKRIIVNVVIKGVPHRILIIPFKVSIASKSSLIILAPKLRNTEKKKP